MECTHSSAIPSYATALIICAGLLVFVLALLIFILLPSNPRLRKKKGSEKLLNHAIVTGGSSGIGLAVALELVQRNCKHVSIIARGKEKLNEAKEELEQCAKSIGSCTSVSVHSVNVGNFEAVKEMAEEICNDQVPPLTMIFNVAGTSVSGAFLDTDPSEFERLMNINYIGSVNTIKAFLPHMKPQYNESGVIISQGIVVLTSSVAGQVGVYGFSAYSPTKFALRGLAEVLQMELSRDNINVQLAFPPDTDTPGYKEEQIGKPEETHLISEVAGLFKPEDVGKKMVSSAIKPSPPFCVYFGLEGWMTATLTAGMAPVHNVIDAMYQIMLMSILRFVSLFYLMRFRQIIHKVGIEKRGRKGEDKLE